MFPPLIFPPAIVLPILSIVAPTIFFTRKTADIISAEKITPKIFFF